MTVSCKTLTTLCCHLPPIDRLSIDSTLMWSLGSADVSLLVPVRANGYVTTLAEAKAADSRLELNDVYTNKGALAKLSDGSCKIAYKVAKVDLMVGKSTSYHLLPRT